MLKSVAIINKKDNPFIRYIKVLESEINEFIEHKKITKEKFLKYGRLEICKNGFYPEEVSQCYERFVYRQRAIIDIVRCLSGGAVVIEVRRRYKIKEKE